MNWNDYNNPFGGGGFEEWQRKMQQPGEPDYPEPPPEEPSKLELTNNLLDVLIIAIEKGNKEEIEAIKEQLKELK